MKLAILFYSIPQVEIHDIPDSIDNVEDYIEDNLGLSIDDVAWACYDDNNVNVRIC